MYLDVLREVLDVAVRKKFLPANPAIGARPIKKDSVPAAQKRRPWSRQQIKDFFEGKFYQSCAPGVAEPYDKPDRAWRFWLPLIMLFSGARPNEIAQLHVKDVQRTPTGTWFLDLADEAGEDGKSLKTISSRRRVPLHPELIRFGFLDFVKVRKSSMAEHGPRLFHELKANKYGNLAWYAARRFNEVFVPAEIQLDARQSPFPLARLRFPDEHLLRRVKTVLSLQHDLGKSLMRQSL
ncbi:hypothetical protein [Hyphomicrobium sp. ghe19]|uniref:hypothetical protein n=1 Tax=Hyphomicrobium sp. ghe19 TaxID=2682968 RepID=UPI0013673015|nr:hypothetical protein HYPP_04079 [Hyphomicrobium sp. ghe19]